MATSTPQRNALCAAYEAAEKAHKATAYNLEVAETVNLLEIWSRRPLERITPGMHQEIHNLFQETAPILNEAERLFNAALAGERLLGAEHAPR